MGKPNVPIEQADLWDILDWNVLAAMAGDATGDPRERGSNMWAHIAKKLGDEGSKPGDEDLEFFHVVVTRFVGVGPIAERKRRAADLALKLGADPLRLIDFVAFKWGLFPRITRRRP